MLKRIMFAFFIAVAFPLIYILIGQKQDWTADDTISDENQNNYTCFHNSSDIMIVKTDSNSEICGKWITQHSYGYNFTNVEAMTAYDGNFYCVLTEINSKNFMIVQRKWLKIDFENNTADILYNLKYNGIQNAYSTSLTVSDGRMYTVSALLEGIQIVDVYNKRQKILNPGIEAIVNYAAALPDGRIIFTDILNRIYIMEQDGDPAMIYETSPGSFSQCTVDNNGYCYIYDLNNGWLVSSDNYYTGKINFINSDVFKDSFTSSVSTGYNKNFIIFCVVGIAAGVIIFIILSLKRISILLKISGIIVLSLGIGGIILFLFIDSIMEKVYLQSKLDRAVMSAKVIEAKIDLDQFADINWNHPEQNKYFYELCSFFEYTDGNDKIKAVIDNNHSSEIILDDNNYCCLYILDNEGIKSGICDEHPVNIPIENIESEEIADVYKSVAAGESESIMYGAYADDFEWVLAISPLKDKNGKIIALIETGISKYNYMTSSKKNLLNILFIVTAVEIMLGILILVIIRITLFPLKKLHEAVEAAGNGDFSITVKANGRDEISGIAKAFNIMSSQINSHTQNLSSLNEAYLRFLPSGIITTIRKNSVLSVSRGDYSNISSYILHINIINFTEQTKNMTNDDIFIFINNLSKEIMENIIYHKGVIESYNQEEYICIFNNPDSAYESGINLVRRLRSIYPYLMISLVLVMDSILLGIVGHEKRLGTIMLSNGIRLSKKLGKIGDVCETKLIVTSDINFTRPHPQRVMGKINFDGNNYKFFDYFECDEINVYLNKLEGRKKFEAMIELFYSKMWYECRKAALSYLEIYCNDKTAIKYLFLCEHNINNPSETIGIESISDNNT